jgi:hypothetical protein
MDAGLNGEKVKVLLRAGENVETLWAERVGTDQFRLENSPFWAYGVSWLDIVAAQPDSRGMLVMTGVVEKSGHRTVRVLLGASPKESPGAAALLQGLNTLGCSYEGMTARYVAVDVPPGIDLARVSAYLTQHHVQWENADPTFDDVHGDSGSRGSMSVE